MTIQRLWLRFPVLLRATVAGLAVGSAGTLPWAGLIAANTRHLSRVPWAVPPMAVFLGLYWLYFVRGRGWPGATAGARRASARAHRLPDAVWGQALVTGLLGLVGVLLLQGVLSRLVDLPQQRDLDVSKYPLGTVIAWIAMSAIVAGVVEETAFRGYLQGPIERRHGLLAAILVSGALFGFSHFTHPEVGLVLLPYYMAVAAVYGGLAYATNSTLPSMVLHAGGNMFSAVDLFTRGRSEWQLSTAARPLVWQTGLDAAFVGTVVAMLVIGALAVWSNVALARGVHESRDVAGPEGA